MNLRQLSEILGLSQTTVSRALNGYPEVNPKTRDRVLAAAQHHNYRPNARARGLATGRAMAVASMIPVASTHEIMNPIFSDFIAGASETLYDAGYDLMLSVIPDNEEAAIYRDMARRGRVDGLMIHTPRSNDPRLKVLRETGLPFVVHGRFSRDDDSYSWVDMDNRRSFALAARKLLDLGHRRIALVNGLPDLDFARRRHAGYVAALSERGIAPDTSLATWGEMTELHGFQSGSAMLELADPPTAFLASSMIVALGIERACLLRELKLGRDIALIMHDDRLSYFRNDPHPRFAAMASAVHHHGELVASMLLDLIGHDAGPKQKLLQARWCDGPTLCPPPVSEVSRSGTG